MRLSVRLVQESVWRLNTAMRRDAVFFPFVSDEEDWLFFAEYFFHKDLFCNFCRRFLCFMRFFASILSFSAYYRVFFAIGASGVNILRRKGAYGCVFLSCSKALPS